MTQAPSTPGLEVAFDVSVRVGTPLDHGTTRAGHRRVVPIVGGEVTGGLTATILPGGADWQVVRPDGVIEIDGRYTARTTDGDLVYIEARGVRVASREVMGRIERGEDVSPDDYYFRTTLRFETSAPALAWLQERLFVASCIREFDEVRYTAYTVL